MNIYNFTINNRISYYNISISNNLIFTNPKKYILKVLKAGDKCLDTLDPSLNRYHHTASIFLNGIMFYNSILSLKNNIDNFINSTDDETEFLYNWFMIAFIHDLGYEIVKLDQIPSIWNTTSKSEIISKILEHITITNSNNYGVIPEDIERNLTNYHPFRIWLSNNNDNSIEFIDHGFLSGVYFIKDRAAKFSKKKSNGELEEKEPGIFIDNRTNLVWSENILNEVQSKISKIIISHNVFYQKPNTKYSKKYIELNMEDLITKTPKFSYKDYPFYFLLQLVDTIDTYKFYKNSYCQNLCEEDAFTKVSNDIDYTFIDNGFTMIFNDFEGEFIRKYWLHLKRQKYWLPISIKKRKNTISIKFN